MQSKFSGTTSWRVECFGGAVTWSMFYDQYANYWEVELVD